MTEIYARKPPAGWKKLQLKELARITAGGDYDPKTASEFETDHHPFPVYANAIARKAFHSYSSTSKHPAGAVTITARGAIGFAQFRDKPFTAIGRLLVVWPNSQFDGRYLAEYLNSQIQFAIESTGVPQLTGPQASSYEILIPDNIAEQEAIGKALSDADALIEGLERLITKKRLIKQGAMQELLTGRRRLPGFSGEWKNFRLSEHGKFLSGSGFPLVYQGHSSGDYPFFKVSDFSGEANAIRLTHSNHYIDSDIQRQLGARVFPPKAIVFAKIGAAIFLERKRMIAQASCLDNNMAAFVLQDAGLCVDLILAKFQFFALKDLVSSTALPAISSSDLKAIEFFLPKALDEQEAIAGVLNDMDAEIQALEERLEKTQQIKEGMMQNLLTGQIRLV